MKNELWSDESLFELYHSPNTQNDRIWANNSSEVTPHETIKNPPKLMVWGMMSYSSLSDLHFVPSKQTVNAQYYVEEILEKTCLCALKRRRKTGPVNMRKMVAKRSEAHFMQDEAPAHRANVTQEWCRRHFNHFWAKEEWPGNSPDLNPIENVWGILKQSMDAMKPAKNLNQLQNHLEKAWKEIKPEYLENIVLGMP